MKKKQVYVAPAILRKTPLNLEGEILSGSVADHIEIRSVGQEVDDYDFSQSGFNHNWGD